MPEALVCRRLRVHGLVQGVGFRWSAVEAARSIGVGGLGGWVRNLSDGSVEILAWGEHEQVMRLLAWARRGPPQACVSRVEVMDEALPDTLPADGFRQIASPAPDQPPV